jgi:chromosome segregation ATPase
LEVSMLKKEIESLRSEMISNDQSSEQMTALQHNFESLTQEKHSLLSEINALQSTIGSLNNSVGELNSKIVSYEKEISELKASSNSQDQDDFIDRLFKQIDILNDERLSLLNEKEQMANQLLKMNDVISTISQEVDSQNINVQNLNNHRRNVILASDSGATSEKAQMKKQINELVREIDKCIALLSA